jgi:hypothetical protein
VSVASAGLSPVGGLSFGAGVFPFAAGDFPLAVGGLRAVAADFVRALAPVLVRDFLRVICVILLKSCNLV